MTLAVQSGRRPVDKNLVKTLSPIVAETGVRTPVVTSGPGGHGTEFGGVIALPGLSAGPAVVDAAERPAVASVDGDRTPGRLDRIRRAGGRSPSIDHDGARQRAETIRRMTIKNLGATRPKDEYKLGDTVRFKEDFARAKEGVISAGKAEKHLLSIAGRVTADDFNLLFNRLAETDAVFLDLNDFLKEFRTLQKDWAGQKFFYEKPQGVNARGESKVKVLSDVSGQSPSANITIYSARGLTDIKNLKVWATKNNIPIQGFDKVDTTGVADTDAPFHGHFGDRAHTVRHARQKRAQGGGLLTFMLTPAGSNGLRELKKDPNKVATEGEGYQDGGFGLKLEDTYVSVAVNKQKDTWNFLKNKIEKIILTL